LFQLDCPQEQTTSFDMTRAVYLVVYNAPLFPAHWGLWIPSLDDPALGKKLHVEGDAANGFEVLFQRNYAVDATTRQHETLLLAEVSDEHVVDVKGDGSPTSDSTAHDNLERILLSVPAPAASLVSSTSRVRDLSPAKVSTDIHDCRDQENVYKCRTAKRGYEMEWQH
jgi:hypothetical protein